MRRTGSTDSDTVRIRGFSPRGRRTVRGLNVIVVFLWLLVCGALYSMVSNDVTGVDVSFGEALWDDDNRRLTVTAVVMTALLLAALVPLLVGHPRAAARREVRADGRGLELINHPKWWYRGCRGFIPWTDVQTISAHREVFSESTGSSRAHVHREILDIVLFREIDGLPDFAAATRIDDSPLDGVRTPAVRVRLGGPGRRLAAALGELAPVVDRARPGLFYDGTAIDQWFTAAPHSGRRCPPEPAPPAPRPMPPAAPPAASPSMPNVPAWLDYPPSLRQSVAYLLVLIPATPVGYLPIHYLSGLDGGILIGLAGLVFAILFLAAVIMLIFAVVTLPRGIARSGIRIGAEGLEFVEKRRWHLYRTSRATLPWSEVQVIVARDSAAVGMAGQAQHSPVVDIYVDGGTAFQRPGVGLPLNVARLARPDSAALQSLAAFPAVRLRLPSSPDDERWEGLPPGASAPHELSAHQLRPVLHAFRPDLCHGFGRPRKADA